MEEEGERGRERERGDRADLHQPFFLLFLFFLLLGPLLLAALEEQMHV